MADRIRAYDWASTPVGPIEQWEDILLTTVNLMLASRHPMFLFWGEELIQFYNDGYRATLDDQQHPLALGNNGATYWANIWHIIGPQIDDIMAGGSGILFEDHFFPGRRSGPYEDTYWTYSYTPLRNPSGEIRGVFVVCTDNTAAVLARRQVELEMQRLGDLFEQAPAFFAVLRGPQHTFERTNSSYQELIGNRDIIGKSLKQALPEAHAQGFGSILDDVRSTGTPYIGRSTPVELYRGSSSETEIRYLDFIYQPLRDLDGSISGIIVFGVDVTDHRRAEQMLLQSEKLTAVGQMASTIAHEINNPLEAVTNLLYLARNTSTLPDIQSYLATAEEELRRVAAITSQTLRFHKQLSKPTAVPAGDLFAGSLRIYTRRIENAKIAVENDIRSQSRILCYEGEIRQVLNNLIGNAIDAMPRGGRLRLRTSEATDRKTHRRGLRLTVSDTGTGMPPQVLRHIFEPFFTTKENRGTGLGLWVSKEIIDRHHGRLRVRSTQSPTGHGTTFTLFLPFEVAPR
jgi:signal transduction histidine kinase